MPKKFYDRLDEHLGREPELAHAVVPMGMLLAWCVKMHLLNDQAQAEYEHLILRIQVEEALGSELLIACGGDLRRDMFSSAGQRFLDNFYPGYLALYAKLFGENYYVTADTWENYKVLAVVLTEKFMGPKAIPVTSNRQNLLGKIVRLFRN